MSKTKSQDIALKGEIRPNRLAWLLVSPSVLVVFAVTILPLLLALALSFTKAHVARGGIQWEFLGLDNYLRFLTKDTFWQSVRVTTFFTFVSLIIELVLGISMALVLNQEFVGRAIVRSLILLPWALPTVVNARMWAWIFDGHGYGALNGLLQTLHLTSKNVVWLQNTVPLQDAPLLGSFLQWWGDSVALNMIILADTWKVTPLVTLLVLAGLQTISNDYYEAAMVDGANAWQRFWRITLPLLRPVLLVILVLRTMELFRVFDILWIIMANTIKVISIYTFEQGMVFGHLGRGSALSFIIGLIILGLSAIYIKLFYSEEDH